MQNTFKPADFRSEVQNNSGRRFSARNSPPPPASWDLGPRQYLFGDNWALNQSKHLFSVLVPPPALSLLFPLMQTVARLRTRQEKIDSQTWTEPMRDGTRPVSWAVCHVYYGVRCAVASLATCPSGGCCLGSLHSIKVSRNQKLGGGGGDGDGGEVHI